MCLFVADGRFIELALFHRYSFAMSYPPQQAAPGSGAYYPQQVASMPPNGGYQGNTNMMAPYPYNAPVGYAVPQQQPFPANPAGITNPAATPAPNSPTTPKEGNKENQNGFVTALKQVGNGAVKAYGSLYVCLSPIQ